MPTPAAVKRSGGLWRRVRQVWVALGIGATLVFVGWSLIAYRASPAARAALRGDARVAVAHRQGLWTFAPPPGQPGAPVGLLFFPGALVDPTAYAPLARGVAGAGFVTHIVELPRRGAFGGADDPGLLAEALALMRDPRGPARWVVAGHSRGGVVASTLASRSPDRLAGLVLIGTSHPRDVSLTGLRVPVTKVVATRDGLASPQEVRANAHLLPPHTRWEWVEGGNHSQFGWYGFQPGDRAATIPARTQQARTVEAVLATLRDAARPPADSSAPRRIP